MKFRCGHDEDWHRWFAWFPAKVGERDCRWLEYVLRRWSDHYGCWVYSRIAP